MSNKRDRAWRRCQRERMIHNRVENDLVPTESTAFPTAIWQLFTPNGVAMPFFKREATGPYNPKKVGDTVIVVFQHEYGCLNEKTATRQHGCSQRCAPYPGPSPTLHWWSPWPAAPVGFVWQLIRFTVPQDREFAEGKLAKWRRPKGTWFFTSATGRKHAVSQGGGKNWKLLYTRHVKVYRAKKLGFNYGMIRRYANESED